MLLRRAPASAQLSSTPLPAPLRVAVPAGQSQDWRRQGGRAVHTGFRAQAQSHARHQHCRGCAAGSGGRAAACKCRGGGRGGGGYGCGWCAAGVPGAAGKGGAGGRVRVCRQRRRTGRGGGACRGRGGSGADRGQQPAGCAAGGWVGAVVRACVRGLYLQSRSGGRTPLTDPWMRGAGACVLLCVCALCAPA